MICSQCLSIAKNNWIFIMDDCLQLKSRREAAGKNINKKAAGGCGFWVMMC